MGIGRLRRAALLGWGIVACAAAASPLRAAAWKRLGPYGGSVTAMAVEPANPRTLYAAVYGIDVFKSTDGGAHWRKTRLVKSKAYTRLAVDPRDPKTVFAAAYDRLYVTRNGGTSWAAATAGLADTYLFTVVVDPSRAGVVFVGALGGVSRSADGGRTWRKVSAGISGKMVVALALHPTAPGLLYAATWESGVYKKASTTAEAGSASPEGSRKTRSGISSSIQRVPRSSMPPPTARASSSP